MTQINNYIVPGLTSIVDKVYSNGSKVRRFINTRHQHHEITPHSHRFDLSCMVLKGTVENTIWEEDDLNGDVFLETVMKYLGTVGQYERHTSTDRKYSPFVSHYKAGEIYYMTHDQIHSIRFSKGAEVLITESEPISNDSIILEPIVDTDWLPTMKVEDWMFQKVKD